MMSEVSDIDKENFCVAVFDVCDTLYFSNTTYDFVDFVVRNQEVKRSYLDSVLTSQYSPLRYLLIAMSVFTGWDYLRKFKIGMLKGYSRKELDMLASEFVVQFLDNRKIDVTHSLINEFKKRRKGRAILCSSSVEPVVAAVARNLQVDDYVCTTLKFTDDVCNGSIDHDVNREKLEDLRMAGFDRRIELAVSDNLGDLALLKAANKSFAVVHSERKAKFWKKHQIESLNPNR